MPFNDNAKNEMLDAFAGLALYASLHTADPGPTGTSEVSGGSPAYARIAVTWDPASGGVVAADTGTPVVFDVPASTIRYGGLWSASSGGTFYGGDAVTEVTFAGQGEYELTSITGTLT